MVIFNYLFVYIDIFKYLDNRLYNEIKIYIELAPVAQLDRVPDYGSGG